MKDEEIEEARMCRYILRRMNRKERLNKWADLTDRGRGILGRCIDKGQVDEDRHTLKEPGFALVVKYYGTQVTD